MFDPTVYPARWFEEKRVTVMGLGLFGGGRGAAEFLCRRGAYVTVTDLRSAEELAEPVGAMSSLPIRWVLGEHRDEDFLDADLVIVNPAVPRTVPLLQKCREQDVKLDTEMNLFFKFCRGKICAITGSNGKTTTAHLVAAMARQIWPDTRLGGNLGRSLLPNIDSIKEDEWVVLELSSFQLEDLSELQRRPEISVVTNLSPNHLDRHGTYSEYVEAKREILRPASESTVGRAVLCGDDALLRSWATDTEREVVWFGLSDVGAPSARGVWYERRDRGDGLIYAGEKGERRELFHRNELPLRGEFNAVNAAGAAAASLEMGVDMASVRAAIREFQPVAHRLEQFCCEDGIEYYDDSIATTPESTIAALEALGPDVHLICGGSSKGCSFTDLALTARHLAKGIYLIGATAAEIESALIQTKASNRIVRCETIDKAVEEAQAAAEPGDRILLSPACPSYDQFKNFEERGQRFKSLCSPARVSR